jgi:hypothetical protein
MRQFSPTVTDATRRKTRRYLALNPIPCDTIPDHPSVFLKTQNSETQMVVAGVFLKANLARFVTLTGSRKSHAPVASRFNKLELIKNPTQDDVEVFAQALKAFCAEHSIEIVVNRRATSGQGAGGAGTFLIEGVLLATSPVPLVFSHSATVAATERKESALKIHRPTTADLGKAYDFAYEGLN